MDPLGEEEVKGGLTVRKNRRVIEAGGGGMGGFCNCVLVPSDMVYSVFMTVYKWSVFQIHDILIWILLFFLQLLSRCQQNNMFFCLLLTLGTFTSFFKGNKLLSSHKTIEIEVFNKFLAC